MRDDLILTGPLLASVIVPTFNRARRLELTLASFLRQTETRFEVVVIDDGSTDETPAVLAEYAGRLRLRVVRQANRGRSAARNAGLAVAAGEALLFCDDDRIAAPGFVAAHCEELLGGGDPKVVLGWQYGIVSIVEPGTSLSQEDVASVLARRPDLACEIGLDGEVDAVFLTPADVIGDFAGTVRDFAIPEPFWRDHVEPVIAAYGEDLAGFTLPWAIGLTGNLGVLRHLVQTVGGFDLSFKGWGLEDADLCLRLSAAGARTLISRRAANYHQIHPRPVERLDEWCRNASYFASKHDTFEVATFLVGSCANSGFRAINEILRAHRQAEDGVSAVLAQALERVMRDHARTLVRVGASL